MEDQAHSNFKKPILLFFQMEMLSHYLRCLQLADAIKSLVECQFVTEKYEELIHRRGYKTHKAKTLSAEMIITMAQKGDPSWVSIKNLEPIMIEQFEIIKKVAPALVINDYSYTAHLAAEMAGVVCVSLINGLFSKHLAITRGVPPSQPGSEFAFLLPQFMINFFEYLIFKKLQLPYQKIRKKYHLSNHRKIFLDEFEGDINLILETLEFSPQTLFPKNSYLLGPLFHIDTKDEADFLQKLDREKKTILVNMGSTGFIENVEFLNDQYFNKFNIIVVGHNHQCLTAPHFIKNTFLNLEAILPHVDLVFTQGGTGNIFQTLSHGIPLFGYPTFFDNEWNCLRIQDLGYGLFLTGKEPLEKIKKLTEEWINKKNELHFKLLAGTISVEKTKERFKLIINSLLNKSNY